MKYTIPTFVGAAGLLFKHAAAHNFDDHDRALQRVKDMKEASPLTGEEANRLRSMIEKGRLTVISEKPDSLPEAEDENGHKTRALGKRGNRGAKKEAPKARAKKVPPKKAPPKNARAKPETKRNAPQGGQRSKPQGNGQHPQQSGRNKPPKETGRHHDWDDYYYDDYYYDDYYYGSGSKKGDDGSGGGLEYTFMSFEGFQDGRGLEVIVPDPILPNEFDAGTVYIHNKEPVYGVFYDSVGGNSTSGIVVDEADTFATVTGKCIRTDPYDELDFENYKGRAYCQFVYSFGSDGALSFPDELTAEGPIEIGEPAVMVVTGGTLMFRRVVGEIVLTPVETDILPSIEFSSEVDLPASYYMAAYIYMDSSQIYDIL